MWFRVSGNSMEPKYVAGDIVYARGFSLGNLVPGNVIVIRDPRDGRLLLKRIGKIENGMYFVEGDNGGQSTDSRQYGSVSRGDIVGRVMFKIPKNNIARLVVLISCLGVIGVIDATYLTINHFYEFSIPCGISPEGCDTVTRSSYSLMLGIPLALYGLFYYLATVFLSILYLLKQNKDLLKVLFGFSIIGFLFSLYFVYLQVFVIGAYCTFCMISAATSTFIFVTNLMIYRESSSRRLI